MRKSELRQPRALALSREEAQHARLRRARAPPRWLESAYIPWKPTALAGRPPPSVHGRASACKPRAPHEQLTCERAQVRTAPTARARSLSGGGAARALATCARPAALVGVSFYPMEAYCAGGTATPLGARPCSGVQAACSTRAADLRACASPNCANRACSLSLGRRRSTRACDVHAPLHAGWSRSIPYESLLRQRDGRLLRCTAVLRRASRVLHTSS